MKNETQIEKLQNIIGKFCSDRDRDQFHNAKDLAIGISTEANELLEILRFKSEDEIKDLMNSSRKHEISEELADVFYFVLRFAQMNDIDLEKSLLEKMKLNEIKYPANKVKGCNKKYNEY